MNTIQKEDFVQAVLIADAYDETLQPFVKEGSTVRIKYKISTLCHVFGHMQMMQCVDKLKKSINIQQF